MAILSFIIFGLIVGLIARAVMPGRQRMGILTTMALGVAGSFLGGFLVALFTHTRVDEFNTAGLIGSVLGSLLLLTLVGGFGRRRAHW
jgi:uncharacterized membrane protein YeaQ/YmgE (transglycosylase-associated protein family)